MKIFGRYVYLVVSKKPIDRLKELETGAAHISKNPRKRKKKVEPA